MIRNITFITLAFFAFNKNASAQIFKNSLRHCLILPIETKNSVANISQYFIEFESFIRKKRICKIFPQEKLIKLLSGQEENLGTYLENKEILKLLAQKTRSGSILKPKIIKTKKRTVLELLVYSEDGENLLFKKTQSFDFKNNELIMETFNNWFLEYSKFIPYHSRIIEKSQDTFLIEKSHFFHPGEIYEVFIYRPKKTQKEKFHHIQKLLIGNAIIEIQPNNSGRGKLQSYLSDFKVMNGDWISIQKITQSMKRKDKISLPLIVDIIEQNHLGIGFQLGIGDTEIIQSTSDDEIGGLIYGVNLSFQYWLSQRFFFAGKFSNTIGSLGIRERSTTTEFYGEPSSILYKVGYKIPQFPFLNKNQFLFSLNRQKTSYHHRLTEKFTPFNITSYIASLEWRYPLKDRNFLSLSYGQSLSSTYDEKNVLNGEPDLVSQSKYNISLFFLPVGKNRYHAFSLEIDKKKAEYNSASIELSATESNFNYQLFFNF